MPLSASAAPVPVGGTAAPSAAPRLPWLDGLARLFVSERERWVLWLPVLIGCGVALYFSLPTEPARWVGPALGAAALAAGGLAAVRGEDRATQWVVAAVAAVAIGFAAAQTRTILLATPTLAERVGPTTLTGRVLDTESLPDGVRLVLGDAVVPGAPDGQRLDRIRLTLRGAQPAIRPGEVVRIRAMVMPPPAPAMPGAYDFQRDAWFQRLSAVGYSLGRASVVGGEAAEPGGIAMWFARLRYVVGERVRAHVDGAAAAVTIALLNGEQRAIPDPVMAAIRDSGLAHLLSISGLHIGLVAGIVLVSLRSLLALVPWIALRFPIKKWAAVVSVIAAGGYTMLADAPVPAQRSFVMVAVVLLAMLIDRNGLSMRLVAFAAAAILLTQPESMLGPSFQMSFGAVVALLAAYEEVRARRRPDAEPTMPRRFAFYLGGIAFSTLIASSATAPFAAYHFDRFQVYGLAANLVAVPLTSFWIMPWAVVALLLMPFGLEGVGLVPMGWGSDLVIQVAETVAGWPGAVILLPQMPAWGLSLVALGGTWVCIWRRRWRWLGLGGIAAGLAGMLTAQVPDLLVDGSGRLMAVRGYDGGLVFSSSTLGRSTREAWLRRAGARVPTGFWPHQGESIVAPMRCDAVGCVYRIGGRELAIVRQGEALTEDCDRAAVVVSLVPVRKGCPSAVAVIDRFDVWRKGAHALWIGEDPVRIESVADRRGDRPWVLSAPRGPARDGGKRGDAGGAASGGGDGFGQDLDPPDVQP